MSRTARLLAAGVLIGSAACHRDNPAWRVPGASVSAGRTALQQYSCGACHQIRGVPGADGRVGPPLNGIRTRTLIAGALPNSVKNLAAWIEHPQEIVPNTGMPDLGVTDSAAHNIVAYLYTLR